MWECTYCQLWAASPLHMYVRLVLLNSSRIISAILIMSNINSAKPMWTDKC